MKILLITIFTLGVSFTFAQNHEHHVQHIKVSTKKSTVKAQFKPPHDLKIRMEKIQGYMSEVSNKKDDKELVKKYGILLNETVNDIFKTCHLDPEADAAIHPALAMILSGAADFKNSKYDIGYKKIHQALNDYEKLFQHEGWNAKEK